MKERPILMSAPMVRAILEGRKTQTRRVVKPQPVPDPARAEAWFDEKWVWTSNSGKVGIFKPQLATCPYGTVGDRLWVRETWGYHRDFDSHKTQLGRGLLAYRATQADTECPETLIKRWVSSIHMPRWASRITLEVTSVRVERLQDISDGDAFAEGVGTSIDRISTHFAGKWINEYRLLWDSINGKKHPWSSNPWVWVITFKRIKP